MRKQHLLTVGICVIALAAAFIIAKRNQIWRTGPKESSSNPVAAIEQVFVTGKVNQPGAIPWTENMTLADALRAAGGASTFGTTRRVFLSREGIKTTYSPLTNDNHKLIPVNPGDAVEVDQIKPWEVSGR